MRLRVGHQQSQFWPILVRLVHYYSPFWGPEGFPRLTNPGVRLCVGYQHSPFCPILVRLVDYYSLFWGPRAISMIYNPRGAFASVSSTLTVLANSDVIRGLLLII